MSPKYFRIQILFIFYLFSLSSCSNYSKLYKRGEVEKNDFNGNIKYETVFKLVIVPVEINGKTYRFLFDTGAPMLISIELQEKLNLKPITSGTVVDSQGAKNKLDYVRLPMVKLGGIGFNKTVALAADLKLSPEISCLDVDGIIGANLMKLAYWKIDFEKQEIFFSSDKQNLVAEESLPLVLPFLTKTSFTPVVNLTVSRSLIKNITFDTGYSGHLSLGGKYLNEEDSVISTAYGYGSSGLYGSHFDTTLYVNNLVQIDSFSQEIITKYEVGNSKKLLGIEFMSQFVLVMDWQNNLMELYPVKTETTNYKTYGITPKWQDGKLIIGTLHKGSEPEKARLKVGDEIKSLNQWDFSEPKINTYCEMLSSLRSENVNTLNIVLKDGREFSFRKL